MKKLVDKEEYEEELPKKKTLKEILMIMKYN